LTQCLLAHLKPTFEGPGNLAAQSRFLAGKRPIDPEICFTRAGWREPTRCRRSRFRRLNGGYPRFNGHPRTLSPAVGRPTQPLTAVVRLTNAGQLLAQWHAIQVLGGTLTGLFYGHE